MLSDFNILHVSSLTMHPLKSLSLHLYLFRFSKGENSCKILHSDSQPSVMSQTPIQQSQNSEILPSAALSE